MTFSRKLLALSAVLSSLQPLVEAQYYNDYSAYNNQYPYQGHYPNSYGSSYGYATGSYYPSYGYGYGGYYGPRTYSNYEAYVQRKLRNALFSWGRTGCTGLVCV